MLYRFLISGINRDIIDDKRKRNLIENSVIKIVKKIPFEKFLDAYKLKNKITRQMSKYKMADSDYSGCLMGAYRIKQMVPTEWFGETETKYQFENLSLNGPKDYNDYLTQMYGEYMLIPDMSQIDSKIHYKIKNGND